MVVSGTAGGVNSVTVKTGREAGVDQDNPVSWSERCEGGRPDYSCGWRHYHITTHLPYYTGT